MNYGLELNKILKKSNLSEEERETFGKFLDGKVYKDDYFYPDWTKKLSELVKTDPVLESAWKKLRQRGLWGEMIALYQKNEWEKAENQS